VVLKKEWYGFCKMIWIWKVIDKSNDYEVNSGWSLFRRTKNHMIETMKKKIDVYIDDPEGYKKHGTAVYI
jgi:hypothetical protein